MADHELNIVIKGKNQTGSTFSSLMTGFNQTLEIAKKVAAALKQAYNAAIEGAALEYSATRFDNLAKSIGTVSDALLTDLRDATHGMVSDSELMASAADFMGLGLAKTSDEVVRLSTVAGALGMNMNQLVLTLTNQTTMRFDALGVSVAGFDEKVKALEESGMSASEAFTEAFLQQAEEQIERVGDATDSTIGDFKRLETQFKNLGDSLKTDFLLPLVKDIIPAVTDLLEVINDIDIDGGKAIGGFVADVVDGAKEVVLGFRVMALAAEAYKQGLIGTVDYFKIWGAGALGPALSDAENLQLVVDALTRALGDNTGAVDKNTGAIQEGSEAITIYGERSAGAREKIEAFKEAAEEAGKALEGMFSTITGAAGSYGDYLDDLDEQNRQIEELQAILNNPLTGGWFDGVYYSVEDAKDAIEEMGNVSDTTFSEFGASAGQMQADFESKMGRLAEIAQSSGGGWFDGVWISTGEAKKALDDLYAHQAETLEKMKGIANDMVWNMVVASFDFKTATEGDLTALFNTGIGLGQFTKEALTGLAGDITTTMENAGVDSTEAIDKIMGAIDGLPSDVSVNVSMALHKDDVDRYLSDLNRSVTIPVFFRPQGGGYPIPEAAGGVVSAAAGAMGGGAYYVGEIGPELFFPAQNGRVVSNSEAKASLRSGRGGGETIVVNINTPMNFADKAWVERELAPYITKAIRSERIRG